MFLNVQFLNQMEPTTIHVILIILIANLWQISNLVKSN